MSILSILGLTKKKKEVPQILLLQQQAIQDDIKNGLRNPDGSLVNPPKYPNKMMTFRPIDLNSPEDQEILRQFRIAYVCTCRYYLYLLTVYGMNYKEHDQELRDLNTMICERIYPWTEEIGFTKISPPYNLHVDIDGMSYEKIHYCYDQIYEEDIVPYLDLLKFDTPEEVDKIRNAPLDSLAKASGAHLEIKEAYDFFRAFASDPTQGFYPVVYKKNNEIAGVRMGVNLKDLSKILRHTITYYRGFSNERNFGLNPLGYYTVYIESLTPKEDLEFPVAPAKKFEICLKDPYTIDDVKGRKFIISPNSPEEQYMYVAASFASMMAPGIREVGQGYLTTHPDPFKDDCSEKESDKEEVEF